MSERDIYNTPEDRVLLRTKDVYQTEAQDDVASYSEKLLEIVADFKNSGAPEGFNAQSMVGKSKRGEVACRLFARIDPATGIIEAAGFKTRGCLAMTGCASAACQLIEGKPLEDALEVGIDDIRAFVDGVPAGKVNALHFAACAIQALVGDFLMRDGASLAELQEAIPCDPDSISCIMAEHCSYRQSLLELRVSEAEAERQLAIDNALAEGLNLVRENTRRGRLTKPADWAALVPAGLLANEFEEKLLALVDEAACQGDGSFDARGLSEPENAGESGKRAQEAAPAARSRFANRGVGVPAFFGKKAAEQGEVAQAAGQGASVPNESGPRAENDAAETASAAQNGPHAERSSVLDDIEHVYDYGETAQDEDNDFELVPPEGYKLVEVDGQWGLVETDEPPAPKKLTIDAAGIKTIRGAGSDVYLFDGNQMTGPYAHWAMLAEEGDPLATFACCVRDESRIYPRPMAASDLANEPIRMDATQVEDVWQKAQAAEGYGDIHRIAASNGDVYFYSSDHLEADHAQSLAEWSSVGRFMNV